MANGGAWQLVLKRYVSAPRTGPRVGVVIGLCALVVAGVPSCGQSGEDGVEVTSAMIKSDARQLEGQGYTEQAALMADGEITADEYQDAFDQLRGCLDGIGMTITVGPYVSPVDGLTLEFMMGPPDPNAEMTMTDSQHVTECDERHFATLNHDYSHSREPQMDPALHSAVRDCLADKGFETSGTEKTVEDFVGEAAQVDPAGSDRDDAVSDCMRSEMERLYSDREIVGGGFGW
ncbi:MAG: hypothetical protein LBK95_19610 [Bifidobacteriaceae bacterium]|jgi:hypothetical protein|nr:hypothetical protein [Bifidobacteriaceae bacterium]